MNIWCIRKERKSIERREARFHALKKYWEGQDLKIFGARDARGLKGQRPDILIVYGSAASVAVRSVGLRGRFNVYTPSYDWMKHRKGQELQEVRGGRYDLIIADVSYWLDDIRKLHRRVHYVDMGFDPEMFHPNPKLEKKWDIAFVGNPNAFGRQRQLGMLKRCVPKGKLIVGLGKSHKEYARIMQQSRIGWNQVGPLGNKLGVNYRVWEVLGSGALLFVNATRDLCSILQDHVHAVFWRSTKEMTDLVGFYLRRKPGRRERIAKAGCELAHSKFTWDHRALETANVIRKYFKG